MNSLLTYIALCNIFGAQLVGTNKLQIGKELNFSTHTDANGPNDITSIYYQKSDESREPWSAEKDYQIIPVRKGAKLLTLSQIAHNNSIENKDLDKNVSVNLRKKYYPLLKKTIRQTYLQLKDIYPKLQETRALLNNFSKYYINEKSIKNIFEHSDIGSNNGGPKRRTNLKSANKKATKLETDKADNIPINIHDKDLPHILNFTDDVNSNTKPLAKKIIKSTPLMFSNKINDSRRLIDNYAIKYIPDHRKERQYANTYQITEENPVKTYLREIYGKRKNSTNDARENYNIRENHVKKISNIPSVLVNKAFNKKYASESTTILPTNEIKRHSNFPKYLNEKYILRVGNTGNINIGNVMAMSMFPLQTPQISAQNDIAANNLLTEKYIPISTPNSNLPYVSSDASIMAANAVNQSPLRPNFEAISFTTITQNLNGIVTASLSIMNSVNEVGLLNEKHENRFTVLTNNFSPVPLPAVMRDMNYVNTVSTPISLTNPPIIMPPAAPPVSNKLNNAETNPQLTQNGLSLWNENDHKSKRHKEKHRKITFREELHRFKRKHPRLFKKFIKPYKTNRHRHKISKMEKFAQHLKKRKLKRHRHSREHKRHNERKLTQNIVETTVSNDNIDLLLQLNKETPLQMKQPTLPKGLLNFNQENTNVDVSGFGDYFAVRKRLMSNRDIDW